MRRTRNAHSSHERWILSYADFITLLFALFVAMYAISQQDKSGAKRFSESVREAVKTGGVPTAIRSLMATHDGSRGTPTPPPGPAVRQISLDPSLVQALKQLNEALRTEVAAGQIGLRLGTRGLIVTLPERSFFPSGDDAIYPASYPAISRVASVIAALPNPVQLEGHTDSVPIHNARFRNNWELSSARSIALLQLFQSKFGLDPGRFVVAGYGQNAPVAPNDSEDGRSHNRRVEIVILSH